MVIDAKVNSTAPYLQEQTLVVILLTIDREWAISLLPLIAPFLRGIWLV